MTLIAARGAARRRDILAWQIGRAVRDTSITSFAGFVGEDDDAPSAGSARRDAGQSPVEMAHNLAVWRSIYKIKAIHEPADEEMSDGR